MIGIGLGPALPFRGESAFSPFRVGAPIVLLDAAKDVTLNGADVSNWGDQSGNGNDPLQGTAANQPLFNASDSDFNGEPSLSFDGVSEFLQSAGFAGGAISQPNTIFIVYKFGDNVSAQVLYDGIADPGRNSFVISGTQGIIHGGADRDIHTEDTDPHISLNLFNKASSDSFYDGAQTTPSDTIGVEDMGGLTLAAFNNGTIWSNVKIAYCLIYNSKLSVSAQNYVGNALALRFGTTWTDILEIPLQFSGLEAWFRSDRGITLNGSDVSTWADQSGNGNDLSQGSDSKQPLFNAIDSNFNGRPSLTFDGIDDFLRSADFASGDLAQPNTIFAVYKFADNTGTQVLYDGLLTTERQSIVTVGTQAIIHGGADQNIHTEDTDPHILLSLYNGASSNTWQDGANTTPGGSVGTEPMGGLTLGALFNDTVPAACEVVEFLIYDGSLTDTEKNLVANYLADKYGITWTDI